MQKTADPEIRLRELASLKESVDGAVRLTQKTGAAGIAVGDAGRLLYSDYSAAGADRASVAGTVAALFPALSAAANVMVDTGYFYALRATDVIVNLPGTAHYAMQEGVYVGVPFLQLLLHGLADYSLESFNLSGDAETAWLKSIEYGACPAYTWVCDNGHLAPALQYDTALTEVIAFYEQANAALGDLRGERIMEHHLNYGGAEGLNKTVYENGAQIFVNYTDETLEAEGFSVPARQFLRVG